MVQQTKTLFFLRGQPFLIELSTWITKPAVKLAMVSIFKLSAIGYPLFTISSLL